MTRSEKLNYILNSLLHTHQLKLEKVNTADLSFALLCNTFTNTAPEWEIEYLRNTLINDGHIVMSPFGDDNIPAITQHGINFIISGGYVERERERDLENKIRQETLKKFHYDKLAFFISILSLLVAIFALLKKA